MKKKKKKKKKRERERERVMAANTTLARKLDLLHHPNLSLSLTTFFSLSDLKATHAHLITSGLSSNPFTAARLLASCAIHLHSLLYATSLFNTHHPQTLFMYNTMIRAFSHSPTPLHSLLYYNQLLRARITPDRLTFPFLIQSCTTLQLTIFGRGLHCHVLRIGLQSDHFVLNNLISMYSGWSNMNCAHQLFDERQDRLDVVSWTALITGYSNSGSIDRARDVFDRMSVRNLISWNAMIAGYAQNGRYGEARVLFGKMPEKNAASWGSMVSGFAQSGLCEKALLVFREMIRVGVVPEEPALISAVSACSQLRSLDQGEWVHGYVEHRQLEMSVVLGTALVDMYGKCGSIIKAFRVFNEMPVKNIYSWNSMITGLAMNGCEKHTLTLFWKMQLMGLEPNAITFVGLLGACSHSGLINEGRWLFGAMTKIYGIRPMKEHYGCMVDLLGRAGLLKEAVDFVESMPVEPHLGLWGALAGACRIHGDVELGEEVAKHLIESEPHNSGRYLLLAGIYAVARRWDDMAMVTKLLRERSVVRIPGSSIVEALPDMKQLAVGNS